MMIKITVLFCSILCMLFLNVSARSFRTPAQSSLTNFVYILKHYRDNNEGLLPFSWEEFEKKSHPEYRDIVDTATKYVDLKNRYIFFQSRPQFIIYGKKEKFIMMATDAELEGLVNANSANPKPGRYVIVELESGKLALKRYSEIGLNRIFNEKGLDLADYTHKRTFQPSTQPKSPGLHPKLLPTEKNGRGSVKPNTINSSRRERDTDADKVVLDEESQHWAKWPIILTVFLVFGSLIVWLKARESKNT